MPEKSLAEIPQDLRELYKKGSAALQRNNLDYAIMFFQQVLQREPAFFDCRQALRATQFKRAGSSTSFFKKMIGSASNSPMVAKAQMALRKDPAEAMSIAEQILVKDPSNASAHKVLAEAALEADLPKTAVLSLEIAIKGAPKDYNLAMQFGRALAAAGEVARAEAVYTSLQKAYPNKGEVSQALKDLSAVSTLHEGGYDAVAEGEGSYRDLLKNKEEAVSLEQASRTVRSEDASENLIREYEARLVQEPQNQKLLQSLGELYTQKKEYEKALDYYNRLRGVEGADEAAVDKAINDITLRKFDAAAAQLDPNAPDHAEQISRIEAEKAAFQLADYQGRVERYPTDLQLRFDLGEIYFKTGKIREAMQEFQKAQASPSRRLQALTYLGHCMVKNGMNDMAARKFQDVIKEMTTFDDKKKEVVYQLGTVLEKMGKKAEAHEQFKLIYEVDIGYKDVADKVEGFYSNQSSEGSA